MVLMRITLKPETQPNDGDVPPRRHRRFVPFVDRQTGEPADLTPKEFALQAAYAPVHALVRALAADDDFLRGISAVREADVEPDAVKVLARRYTRKAGRPQRTMERVIEIAADCDLEPGTSILLVAATGTALSVPIGDSDRTEWIHSKRLPFAAVMLARLGSRRCLVCGTGLVEDDVPRRYCGAHATSKSFRERSDREAISGLLNAVADALEK